MYLEESPWRPGRRRRNATHALHEALGLLDVAFSAIPEGLAICRAVRNGSAKAVDFRIERANAAFRRMAGREADPAGLLLRDAMPAATADWIAAALAAFEQGRPQVIPCGAASSNACDVRFAAAGPERLTVLITDRSEFVLEEHRHAERMIELNHRTKNNLTGVAAMLRLQGMRTSDPELRAQLTKAANRVEAVSDAHASLYRFGSGEVVDLGAYLTDLCERLGRGLVETGRITLEVDAVTVLAPFEDVLPLGIVVNELATNAAKYAYPDPTTGVIRVHLRQTSDGVVLTVSDGGCGLPAELNSKCGGLGMQLVRSLVRQLNGSLEIRARHPGVAFEIRLPGWVIRGQGAQERLL